MITINIIIAATEPNKVFFTTTDPDFINDKPFMVTQNGMYFETEMQAEADFVIGQTYTISYEPAI